MIQKTDYCNFSVANSVNGILKVFSVFIITVILQRLVCFT